MSGKIYCVDNDDTIHCYDPSQDNWTTLPPLPVRFFGLSQVNGKLVAVGGKEKNFGKSTNEVFTYDERSKKWKQTIPPMPTARYSPGIVSLQSVLIVAGGTQFTRTVCNHLVQEPHTSMFFSGLRSHRGIQNEIIDHEFNINFVEIFKADTSQWHTTDPLPTPCCDMSLVSIGNTCYVIGGRSDSSYLNQVLSTSVDGLLRRTIPTDQTTENVDIQSSWRKLANTPNEMGRVAAALLGNNLLVLDNWRVHAYEPTSGSWVCISKLPSRGHHACLKTAANLSPMELILFAESQDNVRVYRGKPLLFQ